MHEATTGTTDDLHRYAPIVDAPIVDAASSLAVATDTPGAGAGFMSRRSVLHHIGLGAATVVVAGIAAGSYRVFDNGVLDAGDGRAYDTWANWRDDPTLLGAVAAAILAANPHNTQP